MIIEDLTLGEMVLWDKDIYPLFIEDMMSMYGDGPFQIVGLRLHREPRDQACLYAVTVDVQGIDIEFAGEWFKRPEKTLSSDERNRQERRNWFRQVCSDAGYPTITDFCFYTKLSRSTLNRLFKSGKMSRKRAKMLRNVLKLTDDEVYLHFSHLVKGDEFDFLFKKLTSMDVNSAEVGSDGFIFIPPEAELGEKDREQRQRICELSGPSGWRNHIVDDEYAGWWIRRPT